MAAPKMTFWGAVPCPTCGAEKRAHCLTLTTRKVTAAHMARIDLWWNTPLRDLDVGDTIEISAHPRPTEPQ